MLAPFTLVGKGTTINIFKTYEGRCYRSACKRQKSRYTLVTSDPEAVSAGLCRRTGQYRLTYTALTEPGALRDVLKHRAGRVDNRRPSRMSWRTRKGRLGA